MSVQLYLGDDRRLLSAGTKITLHSLGSAIDEAMCGIPNEVISEPGEDMISLTEKWVLAFRTKVQVSEKCISFAWQRIDHLSYQVSVVFIPLSDESTLGSGYSDFGEDQVCAVCERPLNLVASHECRVCYVDVCDRCEVRTRKGRVKCYLCLTEKEFMQTKEDSPLEGFRMSLLLPNGAVEEYSSSIEEVD